MSGVSDGVINEIIQAVRYTQRERFASRTALRGAELEAAYESILHHLRVGLHRMPENSLRLLRDAVKHDERE